MIEPTSLFFIKRGHSFPCIEDGADYVSAMYRAGIYVWQEWAIEIVSRSYKRRLFFNA